MYKEWLFSSYKVRKLINTRIGSKGTGLHQALLRLVVYVSM